MTTALDRALDYGNEQRYDLIEYNPRDGEEDQRTMFLLADEVSGHQMLVDIGWGKAGMYANVRHYFEGEPTQPNVFEMDGTVTVTAPLQ